MRNNSTPLLILSVLLVCLLFIGGIAHAQTTQELWQKMKNAEDYVDEKKSDHDDATAHLNKMIGNFVTLHANLVAIKISVTPATSLADLIPEFTKVVEALTKANILTSAMRTMLTNIETQRGTCNTIWADVVLAQTAYEDAVDAYNDAVSPEEQVQADPIPQADPVSKLYLCPGPCSTPFETQVLATTSHQVFCDIEPHKTSGYSYYSCPPDYPKECPLKAAHQVKVACRGGCGTMFPRKIGNIVPEDGSHYKGVCEGFNIPESYLKTFGSSSKMVDCPGRFYNCNGQTSATDCYYKTAHVTDDTDDDDDDDEDSSSRKSASASLTPSSGSSRATAGKVYGLVLKTASAFREVSWYVASPGASGRGTYLGKVRGSSSSFRTSIGHSFSRRSVSGDYVFTAVVRNASDGW